MSAGWVGEHHHGHRHDSAIRPQGALRLVGTGTRTAELRHMFRINESLEIGWCLVGRGRPALWSWQTDVCSCDSEGPGHPGGKQHRIWAYGVILCRLSPGLHCTSCGHCILKGWLLFSVNGASLKSHTFCGFGCRWAHRWLDPPAEPATWVCIRAFVVSSSLFCCFGFASYRKGHNFLFTKHLKLVQNWACFPQRICIFFFPSGNLSVQR